MQIIIIHLVMQPCLHFWLYNTIINLSEFRSKEEELKKQLKPLTPQERAVEKQRIQREQEEADLALAMEAFGKLIFSC